MEELLFTPENVKVPRGSRRTAMGKKGEILKLVDMPRYAARVVLVMNITCFRKMEILITLLIRFL